MNRQLTCGHRSAPIALALGFGTYLFHNTLQVNATQMAPATRGTATPAAKTSDVAPTWRCRHSIRRPDPRCGREPVTMGPGVD